MILSQGSTRERLVDISAGHYLSLTQTMGYRTRVTPLGPDHGINIIAHKRKAIPGEVSVERGSGTGSLPQCVVVTCCLRDADILVTLECYLWIEQSRVGHTHFGGCAMRHTLQKISGSSLSSEQTFTPGRRDHIHLSFPFSRAAQGGRRR